MRKNCILSGGFIKGIIIACLMFCLCLTCSVRASAETADNSFLAGYIQTVYNEESGGMISAEANDVCQSSDGYIWIATYGGLMRYDGNNFSAVNEAENGKLPNFSAMSVCEGNDGTMWVGTNGNGVMLYDREHKYSFIDADDELPSLSVRVIRKDKEGTMYVGTTGGVCMIDKENKVHFIKGTENLFIRDIAVTDNGRVFAITDDGFFVCVTDKSIVTLAKYNHDFSCLRVLDEKNVQVGTISDGIMNVHIENNQVSELTQYNADGIKDIKKIFCDADKRVWVVSDSGVGLLKSDYSVSLVGNFKITSNFTQMMQDSDGNYWITSDKYGLLKLVKSHFTDVSFQYSLDSSIVNAVIEFDGCLYAGTDDGLQVVNLEKGTKVTNALTMLLDGVRIRSMIIDNKGRLLIASYGENTGLVTVEKGGEYSCFSFEQGLPNCKIRNLLQLSSGNILLGTTEGAFIFDGKKIIKKYTKENGLTNTVILSAAEDADGTLYLGSDGGGIFKVTGNDVTSITESDGLVGEVILRLTRDDLNGVIWISTGNTVMYLKDGKVFPCDDNGIYGNVFDFILMRDNSVWMTSANAIYVAPADDLMNHNGNLELTTILKSYGLTSAICANSWNYVDHTSILYLCCVKGICSLDMNTITKQDYIPKINLLGVQADSDNYYGTQNISVKSDTERLTIDFSVLNYVAGSGVDVRYKLVGQDTNYTYVNSNDLDDISYTNLSGGEYTFELSIADGDGIYNTNVISININKQRSLWEYPAFIGTAVLTVILLVTLVVFLIFRARERSIMKRQQELKLTLYKSITALATAIDAKDSYTSGHSVRVAKYSKRIGQHMKIRKDALDDLYYAALMHDVGKIGVPDSILNKPGRLTE